MKHFVKRICALTCAVVLALTGCSAQDKGIGGAGENADRITAGPADKDTTGDTATDASQTGKADALEAVDSEYWGSADEYVWRLAEEGKWDIPESINPLDAVFLGEKAYYTTDGFWSRLEPDCSSCLHGYSLVEHKDFLELELSELVKAVSGFAGSFSYLYVDRFCEDMEGNLRFLTETKDASGNLASFMVTYKPGDGTFECIRISGDFPERNGDIIRTVNRFIPCQDGYFYTLVDNRDGFIIDDEGNVRQAVSIKGKYVLDMFAYGASVWYPSYYEEGYYIFRMDENGEVIQRKPGFASNGAVSGSIAGKIAVRGGDSMLVYNPDTEEMEKLFSWIDADIEGGDVYGAYVVNDSCIAVNSIENGLRFVERVKKADYAAKEREKLVVGCMFTTSLLEKNIVAFNKSQDKYRVTLKAYNNQSNYITSEEAMTRFHLDLTAGTAPDIINIQYFDIYNLVDKNSIEDLGKYIDGDEDINRDDYIEAVLEACTIDGVLTAVPLNFLVYSYVGKASELGNEPGWTIEDISSYLESGDRILSQYWTRDYAVTVLLRYAVDEFIDWEKGVCSFKTESFNALLKILNELPGEIDYSALDNREGIISSTGVSNFINIQELTPVFGDDYVIKGYPTSDGREQHDLGIMDAYSIMSTSANKDGAWEFIKFCLQNDAGTCFTANKEMMQEMIDAELAHAGEETKKTYYTEQGMFNYHYATQEEIDATMRLIEHADIGRASDTEIINIIKEEIEYYFSGIKSADEIAAIIQDRVQLYLDELD